ncbi:MAG: hypothetical protein QW328_07890 [Nitrososphaerota archaeon]
MDILLDWMLYVGIALAVIFFIISLALAAVGRWSPKLFYSSLAGILIGSTASLIYRAFTEGISSGDTYSVLALIIVAGFIVASVIYFAMGKPERGTGYFLAAALAAGFFASLPAIQAVFGAPVSQSVGACTLEVQMLSSTSDTVQLAFTMTYGGGSYDLLVYWGDGQYSRVSISPGETVTLSHSYSSEGGYGVVAIAKSNEGGLCTATAGVSVRKTPLPWFSSLYDTSGASNIVSQLISIPYQLFYTAPEFNTTVDSDDMKTYQMVAAISVSFLGIFLVLRFASGFLDRDPSDSLVDSLKDAIIAVVAILVAPYIYQIFAVMCNTVSLSAAYMAELSNPAGIAAIIGLIAASMVLGVFSSFFGTLGGTLAAMIMVASIAAMIRFALIKAILYCTPLLAVAFLFPVARSAVRFLISVLVGLILAGPVAAFVLVGLSTLPNVGGVAKFLSPVIAMVAFPFLFTVASGGPVFIPGVASSLGRIGAGIAGSLSPRGGGGNVSAAVPRNPGNPGNPGYATVKGKSNGLQNVNTKESTDIKSKSADAKIQEQQKASGSEFQRSMAYTPQNPPENQQGMQLAQSQEEQPKTKEPEKSGDTESNTNAEMVKEESNSPTKRTTKIIEARNRIANRYHSLIDRKRISDFSHYVNNGFKLALGVDALDEGSRRAKTAMEANIAKKEYFEARMRALEEITGEKRGEI